MIVVVGDWRETFRIPGDVEHRLNPGPRWLAPAGGILGFILAMVLLSWMALAPAVVWFIGAAVFVASLLVIGLNVGGPRGVTAAIATSTAGWVPLAAAVLIQAGLDGRLTVALLSVGVVGQVVFVERLRVRLAKERDAVSAARGGARSDGWVVAAAGLPWDRELRVEPSDRNGGPWTGSHADWRAVRPGVGHPVGIWRAHAGGPPVVLLPRVPR